MSVKKLPPPEYYGEPGEIVTSYWQRGDTTPTYRIRLLENGRARVELANGETQEFETVAEAIQTATRWER